MDCRSPGKGLGMADDEIKHDEPGQPEPAEVEVTDNSTGMAVDDRRLDEIEDETKATDD